MKKQRPNLAEVAAAAGSTRTQPQAEPVSAEQGERQPKSERRTSTRPAGTKQIAGHFPAEVSWQLRELALECRTTVQNLLGEALNDLFQKHGKPEIVPGERDI